MKVAISDILWMTTASAILFAVLRLGGPAIIVAFLFLNGLQLDLPVVILFATILFADQREQTLDIATLPGWRNVKKFWAYSFVVTAAVWVLLIWSILSEL